MDGVGFFFFFFQAEDGIRDVERSRGLGDVYKRQGINAEYMGKNLDPDSVSVLFRVLQRKDLFSGLQIKAVNVHKLEPGMILKSGVFSKRGAMLLPSGTILDKKNIEKIVSFDLSESVTDTILIINNKQISGRVFYGYYLHNWDCIGFCCNHYFYTSWKRVGTFYQYSICCYCFWRYNCSCYGWLSAARFFKTHKSYYESFYVQN
eukprot:TRINITY_DN7772_c0_g1_i4.p1 TRINITY_DN7772_c0_g1~~TRINITY_DN7772_c0_g1_i4.p1  ORF type:complete len:205 (+),score=32.56 TRINITY_DN7772_c0_g1_i4:89-703(+)